MTVSATHEASAIATTASAAVPPSARISTPTSAVAGCPAATPGLMRPSYKLLQAEPRPVASARRASCNLLQGACACASQSQAMGPGGAPEAGSRRNVMSRSGQSTAKTFA